MEMPKIRRQLWDVNRMCYWCAKETVWCEGPGPIPELGATIDHLYRTVDPRRKICPNSIVLSCRKCNQARGILDNSMAQKFPVFTEQFSRPPAPKLRVKKKSLKRERTTVSILGIYKKTIIKTT